MYCPVNDFSSSDVNQKPILETSKNHPQQLSNELYEQHLLVLPMELTWNPFSLISPAIILLASFVLCLPSVKTDSDYRSLVYKQCSNQTYAGSTDFHSQILSSLLQELLPQSSHSKFFKSTAGDELLGISGLFQCRGNLSNEECYTCVNKVPNFSNNLCPQAVWARIQLTGCYFQYETDGVIDEMPSNELLHVTCSPEKAEVAGFASVKEAAFAEMESGVVSANGFYERDYGYVHVMGECEADLGPCECGICLSIAVQIAEKDCHTSALGQVYLDNCFVGYSYKPEGAAGNSSDQGDVTRKAIAIVLGGTAALFLGFIFWRSIKSSVNKDDI